MVGTYYFAVFCPVPEGGYAVWFPDVPEANTEGMDMAEAMDMAHDALKLSLEEYVKAGRSLPLPSPVESVRRMAEASNAEEGFAPAGEMLFQLIAAPDMDRTPVKVTISMPRNAMTALDRKAERAGMTRSGYIASMALA